jgi:hypothetical protein
MSKEQNHIIAGAGDLALDAWGLQKTVTPFSMFRSLFTFDVPPKKWISQINGVEENLNTSTLVVSVDSKLSIKTAAIAGDVTYLHSRRHPQYQANRGHLYSSSIFIPVPDDNAVEDFGLFTSENGAFFRVSVSGELYACIQSDGAITHQDKINMPFELDYSKGNVYDIQYQWRGAGNFRFFAGNPKTGRLEVIHEIKNLNSSGSLSIRNPSLPAAYRVTSFSDVGEIQSGCVDITSEGGADGNEQWVSAFAIDKTVSGTNIPVVVVYSPLTAGGQTNTRDSRLVRISGYADKRSQFSIWTTRDGTALTGASFADINDGSFLQQDIAATALDTAKCVFVTTFKIPAADGKSFGSPDSEKISFHIVHGDYIIVTATAANAVCDAVIEFGEEV